MRWLLAIVLLLTVCPFLIEIGFMGNQAIAGTSCNIDVTAQGSVADNIPDVTTLAASGVANITATLNGRIDDSHNGIVEEWGFEWGTSTGNYTENYTTVGVGSVAPPTWEFDYTDNFTPESTIYFRAMARNSEGWGYGGEQSFSTTLSYPGAPINFTATALSQYEVGLTWNLGYMATYTLIRRQVGSYPTTITEGVQVYWGTGNSTIDGIDMSMLDEDVYYSAWSWNAVGYSLTYATDRVEVSGMIGTSLLLGVISFIALTLTFGSYYVKERAVLMIAVIAWTGIAIYGMTLSVTQSDIYWVIAAVGAGAAILCAWGWTRMNREPTQEWDDMADPEMEEETRRETGKIKPRKRRFPY